MAYRDVPGMRAGAVDTAPIVAPRARDRRRPAPASTRRVAAASRPTYDRGVRPLALLGILGLLGARPATAGEPSQILRYGTIAPEGSPWAEDIRKIGAEIAKQSHGSLQLRAFAGAVAGDEGQLAGKLASGQLEIAGLSGGALFGLLPEAAVLELPFLFRSHEEAERTAQAVLPFLRECASKRGLWLIGVGQIGFRHLGTRAPVQTMADLRKVTLRSQPTPAHAAFWDALGVRHKPIGVPDVVRALEAGEVDAVDGAYTWVFASAWHLQLKHFTETAHIFQPGVVLAGKKGAAMVPRAVRTAVEQRIDSALIQQNARHVREVEAALAGSLASFGVAVHPMPPALGEEMQRLSRPVIEAFRKGATPTERKLLGLVEAELAKLRKGK